MSKKILADQIEGDFTSRAAAERAIDSVFNGLSRAVAGGETIRIHDFGRFEPKERAERMGRNPSTGEAIKIAAKRVIGFSPKGVI